MKNDHIFLTGYPLVDNPSCQTSSTSLRLNSYLSPTHPSFDHRMPLPHLSLLSQLPPKYPPNNNPSSNFTTNNNNRCNNNLKNNSFGLFPSSNNLPNMSSISPNTLHKTPFNSATSFSSYFPPSHLSALLLSHPNHVIRFNLAVLHHFQQQQFLLQQTKFTNPPASFLGNYPFNQTSSHFSNPFLNPMNLSVPLQQRPDENKPTLKLDPSMLSHPSEILNNREIMRKIENEIKMSTGDLGINETSAKEVLSIRKTEE